MPVSSPVTRRDLLRYRAHASRLDRKVPIGSVAAAAWGGLQDSVPRGGVISLHARVEGTRSDSWEDPSLVQVWFRGGADFIVPRADVATFTLGCLPRDPERAAELERLADEIHRVAKGEMTPVGEVAKAIGHTSASDPLHPRVSSATGRVHIRWDASRIWLIPVDRPTMDPEEARRALARRFFHWYAPASVGQLGRFVGASRADTRATFAAIESELVPIEIDADVRERRRFALASDLEALRSGKPIEGVRLLPQDDPLTKLDHELLVSDSAMRGTALSRIGASRGYIPGAMLLDGEIVGGWQRQQRKVTLHPFGRLPAVAREAFEAEALGMPIAGPGPARVIWSPATLPT